MSQRFGKQLPCGRQHAPLRVRSGSGLGAQFHPADAWTESPTPDFDLNFKGCDTATPCPQPAITEHTRVDAHVGAVPVAICHDQDGSLRSYPDQLCAD
ncbi:hypothetical protein BDB13_5616 [Rhodococcus sp. OK302]|nr:hypothetical protein BDB13_5616 [Rhodococcus sp. OK302]